MFYWGGEWGVRGQYCVGVEIGVRLKSDCSRLENVEKWLKG